MQKKPHRSSLTISICIALASITLAAYWEVQGNDFVNYDDYSYITQNSHVNSGLSLEGLVWAFTSRYSFNWHPLTWLSHMLDVELYGLNPAGHHWNSLLFHLSNTLLLFLLLHRMTRSPGRSALVAALFSLHPLHVESVAWVSERKDVLSTFFYMMTILVYADYAKKPGILKHSLALVLFAMGLMSKPMVVTLPFTLLLLDYWPLGRFRTKGQKGEIPWHTLLHLCWEKMPFFVLSTCSSLLTFWVQKTSGAVVDMLPLGTRIGNALVSYVRYIQKMVWPVNLSCFYPHPGDGLSMWQVSGAFLLLALITLLAVAMGRDRPYLLVGWLWYLGTLVPVIGVIQVGEQAMADRYTYIPLIGLFIMVIWGLSDLLEKRKFIRSPALALCLLLLLSLFLFTREQVRYWKNTTALFEHEIRATKGNYLAHFYLAAHLEQQEGKLQEAYHHLWEALRLRPRFQRGHYHLGNILVQLGRSQEALKHFSRAIELDPNDYRAHNNMGFVMLRQGRTREAAHHFSEALRIHPEDGLARHNLGLALRRMKESDKR